MEYRYASQTVYQIEYHFVWVTKYRYREPRLRTVFVDPQIQLWDSQLSMKITTL